MLEWQRRPGLVGVGPAIQAPTGKDGMQEFDLAPLARRVLARHYLRRDRSGVVVESPRELLQRVARAIALPDEDPELAESRFFDLMAQQAFLPNSPTLMNAGLPAGMLSGCFVLPLEDSLASIYETRGIMAQILASGGGVGLSFGRLHATEDAAGFAGGPVRWLESFACDLEVLAQGGRRRGAAMGMMPVWHADILEFIDAKNTLDEKNARLHNALAAHLEAQALGTLDEHLIVSQLTSFNLSVAITDSFMATLQADGLFDLRNPRTMRTTRQVKARELWGRLLGRAWKTGEPGIFFSDRANARHPLTNSGWIEATNPCGEQPLLPYESCNLGSINVAKFYDADRHAVAWERLGEAVDWAVRFLDNVIDANWYPHDRLRALAVRHRKVGLGVMGFADLLVRLGLSYDSEAGVAMGRDLMAFVNERAHAASEHLAGLRGVFPGYMGSRWERLGRPMRHACVTTVAPTGTISLFANCSAGLEPVYAIAYERAQAGTRQRAFYPPFAAAARERGFDSPDLAAAIVANGGSCRGVAGVPEDVQRLFATSRDIAPAWHVRMQAAFQDHCDAAVSKTVNLPAHATRGDVDTAFMLAWELGCKGITIYREGARPGEVFTSTRQPGRVPSGRKARR